MVHPNQKKTQNYTFMLNESFGVYDIAEILPNSKIYNFMHFNSIILGIFHKQWFKNFQKIQCGLWIKN
jgi:hypothetical protein